MTDTDPDLPTIPPEQAPSGDPEREGAPLGVPADEPAPPAGPDAMPGIPTEGEPPSSG